MDLFVSELCLERLYPVPNLPHPHLPLSVVRGHQPILRVLLLVSAPEVDQGHCWLLLARFRLIGGFCLVVVSSDSG